MKKLFLSIMLLFAVMSIQGQRCAVLEFKAGAGISQNDVDGISAIFITYFRPTGYTMVERTQIDQVIEEQGFQRSRMTENQMVRVGKILNVSKIVVGDVNVVMGQYNVDVRVINVETGTIAATEGSAFTSTSYRTSMQNVAQKLANKIANTASSSSAVQTQNPSSSSTVPKKRNSVEILYGYLKIFPNELGMFSSEPISVINQINTQVQFGYNNWRLPTNEELSLLRANNYLSDNEYMTRENKRGIVLLVSDGKDYAAIQAEKKAIKDNGWIDLGLPSGTLWKNKNEMGGFYTYEQAVNKYRDNLPSKEQFQELIDKCNWSWIGNGYKIIGPSGDYIILQAEGWRKSGGSVDDKGLFCDYWTSTPYDSGYSWYLMSYPDEIGFFFNCNSCGFSVRLVCKK